MGFYIKREYRADVIPCEKEAAQEHTPHRTYPHTKCVLWTVIMWAPGLAYCFSPFTIVFISNKLTINRTRLNIDNYITKPKPKCGYRAMRNIVVTVVCKFKYTVCWLAGGLAVAHELGKSIVKWNYVYVRFNLHISDYNNKMCRSFICVGVLGALEHIDLKIAEK